MDVVHHSCYLFSRSGEWGKLFLLNKYQERWTASTTAPASFLGAKIKIFKESALSTAGAVDEQQERLT